jgi:serine protease Do
MTSIPKIIARVSPALVSIVFLKPKRTDVVEDDIADRFDEIETGSGFFVDRMGTVATNRHVIVEPGGSYLVSWRGERYPAKVLSLDVRSDVAILKIELCGTPFIRLGDSRTLRLGDAVIAIGNVLGELQNTVSVGIVSGLSRNIYAVDEQLHQTFELRGMIQTDAAINPGNSGGPLLDRGGKAIGINTATISQYENIGFAIPIERVTLDLDEVRRFGRVRRPYLGIRYTVLDPFLARKYNLDVERGAYVLRDPEPGATGVVKGSPADEAGLKEGDVILECGGESITPDHSLKDILSRRQIGSQLACRVRRGNQEFKTKMALKEQEQ